LQKQNGRTAVCIDLTCLRANFAPGVSEPNAVFGLTEDMLKEQISELINQERDHLVVISEYNPAIEKFKTGEMAVKIWLWFLEGWMQNIKH